MSRLITRIEAHSKPLRGLNFEGQYRAVTATYICDRCGIERSRGGGRGRSQLCADCLLVDPHCFDMGER